MMGVQCNSLSSKMIDWTISHACLSKLDTCLRDDICQAPLVSARKARVTGFRMIVFSVDRGQAGRPSGRTITSSHTIYQRKHGVSLWLLNIAVAMLVATSTLSWAVAQPAATAPTSVAATGGAAKLLVYRHKGSPTVRDEATERILDWRWH